MKTSLKKRFVSSLLALTMVLGFLPANLFPKASAAESGKDVTVTSWTWDKSTGEITVNLAGTNTTNQALSTWYLMVVPEYRKNSDYSTPKAALDGDNLTAGNAGDASGAGSLMASNTGLPNLWAVTNSGPSTWTNNTLKVSGSLPTDLETQLAAQADGYNKGDTINFTFVFYSSNGTIFQYGSMPAPTIVVPAHIPDETWTYMTDDESVPSYSNQITNDGGVDATDITITELSNNTTMAFQTPSETSIAPNGTLTLNFTNTDEYSTPPYGTVILDVTYHSGTSTEDKHATVAVSFGGSYTVYADKVTITIKEGETGKAHVNVIAKNGTDNVTVIGAPTYNDGTGSEYTPTDQWTWTIQTDDAGGEATGTGPSGGPYGLTFANYDTLPNNDAEIQLTNSTGLSSKGGPNRDGHYPGSLAAYYGVGTYIYDAESEAWMWGTTEGPFTIPIEIIVTANTTQSHSVTFDADGGTPTPDPQTVTDGGTATEPSGVTKSGYTLDGWYNGSTKWDFSTPVTTDVALKAKWTPDQYTITYNLDGGTAGTPANPTTYTVETAAFTLSNPTKTGYTFTGWSGTGLTGDANKTVTVAKGSTGNREYTAHWTANEYNITYMHESGSSDKYSTLTPTKYTYGVAANLPAKAAVEAAWTKQGYTFAGWVDADGNPASITATTIGDQTFYAKWSAGSNAITYMDGSIAINGLDPAAYTTGETPALPNKAAVDAAYPKTGYEFKGWYANADFSGGVVSKIPAGSSGNKTYYGKWDKIKYTITYELNGGTVATANPAEYYVDTATFTLHNPTKTGHTFDGWSGTGLTGNANKTVTVTKGTTGNLTFTANWTAEEYNINYFSRNNKENLTPATYTYGVGASLTSTTPADYPPCYVFQGWFDGEDASHNGTGNKVETIANTATGDKTVYAQWTAGSVTLNDMTISANPGNALDSTLDPNGTPDYVSTQNEGSTPDTYTYQLIDSSSQEVDTVTLTDSNSGESVTVEIKDGKLHATSSGTKLQDISVQVTVKATSNTNRESDTANLTVSVPAPPKITNATKTADSSLQVGGTVTLDEISLEKDGPLHASDVGSDQKVTTAEWYLGTNLDQGGTGIPLAGTSGTPSDNSGALPTYANGMHLWVKLGGNGSDVHSEPCWVDFGEVGGAPTATLTVSYVVVNAAADGTVSSPTGVQVSNAVNLAAGGTTTIQTVSTNADYVFKGWSRKGDKDALTTLIANSTDSAKTSLTGQTTNTTGLNTATYTMATPQAADTIYAVYQAVNTYTLTVAKDAGIAKVQVFVNGVENKTYAGANGVGAYSGIKATDVVTITSTADTNYVADGFTPKDTDATNKYTVIQSTSTNHMIKIGKDATVTAKAKAGAPSLVLTPKAGTGSVDSGVAKEPEVGVTNNGQSTATVTAITVKKASDGTKEVDGFTLNATDSTLAVNGTVSTTDTDKKLVITPPSGLAAGTYSIPVEVKYKDADNKTYTATTTVTYVVSATNLFEGTVTVELDGAHWEPVSVKLEGVKDPVNATATGGIATFEGLTIGTNYPVESVTLYDGKDNHSIGTYTVTGISVNSSTPNVVVAFDRVQVRLANDDAGQAAVGKEPSADGKKVVVKSGDQKVEVNATNIDAKNPPTATKIVQEGMVATLDVDLAAAAPGYSFKNWTTVDKLTGDVGTDAVSTVAPYNVQVGEDTTRWTIYVAHLKKDAKVVLTYNANVAHATDHTGSPVVGVPASEMVDKGGKATVSTMKPVLGGYVFKEWNTEADGTGDKYDGGAKITMNANDELFAVWKKAEITFTTATPGNGVYGSGYSYTVAATRNDGVSGLKYTVSDGALPGGLALNETTGVISGIPYEVGDFKLKLKAQPADGTSYRDTTKSPAFEAETAELTITIAKATPVITGVSPVGGVVSGQPLNSVGWTITVTGPRFKRTTALAANTPSTTDDWEQYTDTITYAAAASPAAGAAGGSGADTGYGQVTLTSTGNKFAATSPTSVNAAFAAQAKPDSGDFDTAATSKSKVHNKQNKVWKNVNKDVSISHNGDTPKLEVQDPAGGDTFNSVQSWLFAVNNTAHDPAHENYTTTGTGGTGYVTPGTDLAADDVDTKTFTIKNNGTAASGNLTYSLSCSNDTYAFTQTHTKDALTAGAEDTITVTVPSDAPVGTYTGKLTVTGAAGGTAVINVTFVVTDAKTFDGIVYINTTAATTGATEQKKQQHPITNGVVKIGDTAVDWDSDANGYKLTGLEVGKSYSVTVQTTGGEYTVPGAVISADVAATTDAKENEATVTMFEVKTAKDPDGLTFADSKDLSGAGWYVKDQYAGLGAPSEGTLTADSVTTTYVFSEWKKGDDATYGGPAASVKVEAPATYTAKYDIKAAGTNTVTYQKNTDAETPYGPTVKVVKVIAGSEHSVVPGPSLEGYVFKQWNAAHDGLGTGYAPGASLTVDGDKTLYAIWEKAAIGDWADATDTATYGVPYSYTVPMPTTTDGAGVTLSAVGKLPGGLSFDPDTGIISGIPYVVTEGGTDHTIQVKATHKVWDGSTDAKKPAVEKTFTLTLAVNKYTPVLSNLAVTNVASNQAFTTATYTGTLTAPHLKTKGDTAEGDKWDTENWIVGYDGTASPATVTGPNGIAPSVGAFTADGTGTVTVTYTPVAEDARKDANDSTYNLIYNSTNATVTASLTNTYNMLVQLTPEGGTAGTKGTSAAWESWSAKAGYTVEATTADGGNDTTNNKVNVQTFTLFNEGNQDAATITYTWGSSGTTTSAFFTAESVPASLKAKGSKDGDTATDSAAFTVKPNDGLGKGTYSDTLTIKNKHGASVTVKVKIVVDDPNNYTVEIDTAHWDVGATESVLKNVTGKVELIALKADGTDAETGHISPIDAPADEDDTRGKYITATAVYGTTYGVKVNGFRVPNLTVSSLTPKATVDLYQVTVADVGTDRTTAVSMTKNKASAPNSEYIVKGDDVTVTYGTPANANYGFVELDDVTAGTDEGEYVQKAVTGASYTQTITSATAFAVVWRLADTTYTLTYDLNDGTEGTPTAIPDPLVNTGLLAGAKVIIKGCNATKGGATFGGWTWTHTVTIPPATEGGESTTEERTETYQPGAVFTMPAENVTLKAIWKDNTGMDLPGNSWTVAYKDALGDKVITAGGGIPPYTYGAASFTNGSDFTFNATTHTISGTANTYDATDAAKNVHTADITATDSATPTAGTATGTFTIKVIPAKTEVTAGFTVPDDYKPLPGADLDISELDDSALKVDYKKTDGTHNGDFAKPKPADEDPDGTWKVVGSTSGTGGKVTYTLEFTPADKGFLPCQTTVEVQHQAKKIAHVDLKLTFPASSTDNTPVKTGAVEDATEKTGSSETATKADVNFIQYTDATDNKKYDVSWVSGVGQDGKFDATDDITAYMVIKPVNDWIFVTEAAKDGPITVTLKDTGSEDDVTATVISCSETEAVVSYTWRKKDQDALNIQDQVVKPVAGNTPNTTATPVGTYAGRHTANTAVTWIDITAVKAVEATKDIDSIAKITHKNWATLPAMAATTEFVGGQKYVAIVTVDVVDGYYFNNDGTENKSLAALDHSNEYAQIRGDLDNFANAKVLKVMDADGNDTTKTTAYKAVIAAEFTAVSSTEQGLNSASGPLVYYAQDSVGHTATSDTGHNTTYGFTLSQSAFTVYTIDSLGNTTQITTGFGIFVDANNNGKYDATETVLVKDNDTETADVDESTYTFVNTYTTSADLTKGTGLDGAVICAVRLDTNGAPTTGKNNAATIGKLVVKELKADKIAKTAGAPVLSYAGTGDALKFNAGTTAVTATVDFNTGMPMANTVPGMTYKAYDAPGAETFFYEMGDANADTFVAHNATTGALADNALLTELIPGTTEVVNGKTLYMTYIDKNNNLVRTPLGVFTINGALAVKVNDENDHEPEYNDKLTAIPSGGTPNPDGTYTYTWEKEVPDPDNEGETKWVTLTPADADHPEVYTPVKDDVEHNIRVTVTDAKGNTATWTDKVEKRSLNFIVTPQNKNYDGNANNKHKYLAGAPDTGDFTPTMVMKDYKDNAFVNAAPPYGGLVAGDKVNIGPSTAANTPADPENHVEGGWNAADAARPPYADKDVGKEITWPQVLDDAADGKHVTTTDYALTGDQAAYYRLRPQDAQTHRGIITGGAGDVVHVNVDFKKVPEIWDAIPNYPDANVSDGRETRPGEIADADDTVSATDYNPGEKYIAMWYTPEGTGDDLAKDFDPTTPGTALNAGNTTANRPTDKYFGGGAVTVVVKVRPRTVNNARYKLGGTDVADRTRFTFHFGPDQMVEVSPADTGRQGVKKDDDGVYYMWYTFNSLAFVSPTFDPNLTFPDLAGQMKYYAQTGTADRHHAVNTTGDNTPIPGGKKGIPFQFALGAIKNALNAGGTDGDPVAIPFKNGAHAPVELKTADYGKTWRLVAGTTADTATLPLATEATSGDTVTATAHTFADDLTAASTAWDSTKYDSKNVYVQVIYDASHSAVYPVSLGTLSVKQLTAESIAATKGAADKTTFHLAYNAGEKFDVTSTPVTGAAYTNVTGASVTFKDYTPAAYAGAEKADKADISGAKYYFQYKDWDEHGNVVYKPLKSGKDDGTALTVDDHNGKYVYICYTDVNGSAENTAQSTDAPHIVRALLGKLSVTPEGQPATSTAAIYVKNNTRSLEDTMYGDELEAVVIGQNASGDTVTYKWQRLGKNANGTLKDETDDANWEDIQKDGTNVTAKKYIASKDDVETKVRVVITGHTNGSGTAYGDAKGTSDPVSVAKKPITLTWTVTPNTKVYDGTTDLPTGAAYTSAFGAGDLVKDFFADAADTADITAPATGAYDSADAGDRTITGTDDALDEDKEFETPTGAKKKWSDLYITSVTAPQGTIEPITLDWTDFTFTGKVKRYDGNTNVYKTDNTDPEKDNTNTNSPADALTNNVNLSATAGADKDSGLWTLKNPDVTTTSSTKAAAKKYTDAQVAAIEAAVKAINVKYTSEHSMEGNTTVTVAANGHSVIQFELQGNDNIKVPAGLHTVTGAINAMKLTVGVANLGTVPSVQKDTTARVVTIPGEKASGIGTEKPTFSVQGYYEDVSAVNSSATVTILNVQKDTSKGITEDERDYWFVWDDSTSTTGSVTGGTPASVTFDQASIEVVYGDTIPWSKFTLTVTMDDASTASSNAASIGAMGFTVIYQDEAGWHKYAGGELAKWDRAANTTASASLPVRIYHKAPADVADDAAATTLASGIDTYVDSTITVTPRPLTAAAAWSLKKGDNDYTANGKFYDGTTAAKSASLWAKKGSDPEDATGSTGSIAFTLTNDAFGDLAASKVSIKTSDYTAVFADKNVGTDKTINVGSIALDGTYKNRYTVNDTALAKGTIVPRPITVTFDPPTVPLDTTDAAASKIVSLSHTYGKDDTLITAGTIVGTDKVTVSTRGTYDTVATVMTAGTDPAVNNVTLNQTKTTTDGGYLLWDNANYVVSVVEKIDGSVVNEDTTPDDDVIQHVYLLVTAPVAEATPATDATVTSVITAQGTSVTPSDAMADATPAITWADSDGNAVTTFERGKSYVATISGLDDKTPYTFASDVDFSANGSSLTVGTAAGKDAETVVAPVSKVTVKKVMNAAGDAVESYTVVVEFEALGDKQDLEVWGLTDVPALGDTIASKPITIPAGETKYEIVTGTNKWYTDAACTTEATDKFVAGVYYAKLTVKLTAAGAAQYRFTEDTLGYINDKTAYATGDPFTGTKKDYTAATGSDPDYITLVRAFKVEKKTVEVHVQDKPPEAGDQTVVDSTNADIKKNPSYDGYRLETVYPTGETTWKGQWFTAYDAAAKTVSDPATEFVAGTTYYLEVTVEPGNDDTDAGNYELPAESGKYIWDTNPERKAIGIRALSDGKYAAIFEYRIPMPGEAVVSEIPGNARQPEYGKPLTDGWTSENFTKEDFKWYEGTVDKTNEAGKTPVAVGTNAKEDTVYTAVITVKPKEGVTLAPDGSLKYTFNGQDITARPNEWNKNDDGTYTLYHTFDKTGKKEVIEKPGDTVYVGGGGGGGGSSKQEIVVTYALREFGVTNDLTAEKISKKGDKPTKVPKVEPLEGLKFLGWSETDPSKLKDGKLPTLVDPTTFKIDKDKTFYAVYEEGEEYDHTHYVIGFPDGTFAPDANITRAEVATIIARSCLEGFVEGSDYGNPGNYTDVAEHWAFSAISYCSQNGVFNGYDDGTFRPDRFISRQELATVVARLAGMKVNQGMPFSDADEVADWAKNGVYTAFANRWINGYEDGSFRPLQDITRAETVRIFNGYLNRGVDADGLDGLKEYVHSGVASNNTENGKDEYMTWPDVPKSHWAYYEIIEAANDHNYEWKVNDKGELTETPPEDWYEVYIDEKWRYFDDANDNADNRGEDKITQVIVTYVVKSGGVVWDSKTEVVNRFESPSVAGLPNVTANEGFRFAGWSDVDPDTGAVNLVDPTANYVTEDTTFYAVFEEDKPYEMPKVTITYVITAHGSSDSALTETIDMYESPTVAGLPLVTAEPGYRFAGWTDTDPSLGGYTFLDPTASPAETDKTFYAVFESEQAAEQDKVTVTYVVGDYGTTDAALTEVIDKYESPTVAALPHVTPVDGYRFVSWSTLDPATGMTNEVDPTASYLLEDTTFYAVLVPNQSDGPVNNTPVEPSEQPEQPVEEPEQPTEAPEQPVEEPTEPVTYARTKYISGFEDGTFRPDESITRAAVANIIAGLTGYDKDEVYADKGLTDLEGHWAKNVIAYCVSAGLMGGYEDGTFRPDQSMSRQELAVVMARLSGDVLESQGLDFADADAVATWAQDGVYTACANGWMKGYEDGSFLPERQVTRAEAVKMFNAYLDRSADPEAIGSQSGYTVWADVPETHWAYYEILEASNNWAE